MTKQLFLKNTCQALLCIFLINLTACSQTTKSNSQIVSSESIENSNPQNDALILSNTGVSQKPENTNSMNKNTTSTSTSTSTAVNNPKLEGIFGQKARGLIPSPLGDNLLVGLFENKGESWMKNSNVKWNARYLYLTKGWVNNWGWGKNDGSYALEYMRESSQIGTLPVIQYYIMNNEPGGGENAFYEKTKNPKTMLDYFTEYKLLIQRAKDYNKPVLILLEADGFGYMQQQSKSNPNAYSAIADSGMPELADLPNTAAGWGLSFLKIRKALGAKNVVLGMHISAWASSHDIAYVSVNIPLQAEVDKVYDFLMPFGLGKNQTGDTYDVLCGDPLDRDSDFYKITQNQDRTWDASDSAPISTKSFNRYAEWLRLWNIKANMRWILWQIPLGNSNHLNKANTGKPSEGYKDNRTEYFFGSKSTAHLAKWADCGVIALLFGAGVGGQATYTNDVYSDGQLYMKSGASSFFKNGGMRLYSGH